MKKVLIISFYGLYEYLMNIKELFQSYHYDVSNYPLFQVAYDANDKVEDYKTHMNTAIKNYKPDIILWWFLDVPSDVFKYIKQYNPNVYFIMFNGDDPMNYNVELLEKAKIFDLICTSCKEHIKKYTLYSGVKNVIYNIHGYDPVYFHRIDKTDISDDEYIKYNCDISIYCHSLYTDPCYNEQIINRKRLIDDIVEYCNEHDKIFKIYGPMVLKSVYPKEYGGESEYINQNKIFNFSRINIVTHPFSNKEASVTEIETKILGSGGLLYIDPIKGINDVFKNGYDCVHISETNYITQINDILTNYGKYEKIREQGHITSKKYTWSKFIEKIHINICKHFFDEIKYKQLYDINDDTNLWEYWLSNGLKNKEIPYQICVPNNFNHEDYATFNNIISKSPEYIYLQWYLNGKDQTYIKKTNNKMNSIDSESLNINMENMYKIFNTFTKIYNSDTKYEELKELRDICTRNPKLKINNLLEIYMNMCDK